MGLFSQRPASRFLDDASKSSIEEATRILLSNFFDVMRAQTVHLQSGVSPLIEAHLKTTTGTSLPELSNAGDRVPGPLKIEVLPTADAISQCCLRMTQAPQPSGISTGITFGLDKEPNGPSTTWGLWLHRGPLPLLELYISDGTGFKPPRGWAEGLISNEAAHVVWISGKGYVGGADHLYLWLKRQKLFPYSKGESSDGAVVAGQHLRRSCQEVWSKESDEKTGPYKLSSWRWSQKRFVRKFDKILVGQIGSRELAGVLKAMGTNLDDWLQACE
jgi:hypothetical protein